MAGKKYTVLIDHLVGFDKGDKATSKELEAHGGTVAHLIELGAIGTETKTSETEAT